jgi:transcriptional antiterminator NusG
MEKTEKTELNQENSNIESTHTVPQDTELEPKKEFEGGHVEDKIDVDVKSLEPKWYVLHTYSGYEQVGKTNLEMVVKKYHLEDRIFDIIIPMEETIEERNGKKKLVSRKLMPCYLLVKMKYADDLWHNVTRTRGITGFVGPKGRPLPLTQDEIRKLHLEKVVVNIDLRPNDKIEVIDGPLNSFIGTVISVDASAKKCKVNVEMFGRETPVDLEFSQIRKI